MFIVLFCTPVQLTRNPWCNHIAIKKREIICQDFSEQSLNEIPLIIQDNVTDINLRGNFIQIVKSGAFKDLKYLQQIDLGRNHIWAALCQKVPNVLSRCHTKRRTF